VRVIYVRSSYNVHFKIYNLYFGDVDTFGENDRSRPFMSETRTFHNLITINELESIRSNANIPELAANFLDIYITTYKSKLDL
jgi:hypothetical protein